jgi:hypothetical protein
MLIEPGVEVNAVVQKAPPEADSWHPEFRQEGWADAEICSGLVNR